MFAVTVMFKLHPDHATAFMAPMIANAQASLRDEPGCHRFDVCSDSSDPAAVFLYELYDDRAAFDRHRTMPHYHAFEAAIDGMVADKQVWTFDKVQS